MDKLKELEQHIFKKCENYNIKPEQLQQITKQVIKRIKGE